MENISKPSKSNEFSAFFLGVLFDIGLFLLKSLIEVAAIIFGILLWVYLMVIKWSIYLFISIILVAFLNR